MTPRHTEGANGLVGRREKREKSKGRKRRRLAMAPEDAGAGSPAVAGPVGWCRREGGGVRCEGTDRADHGCQQLVKEPVYLTKPKTDMSAGQTRPWRANQVSEARHTP